MSISLSLSDLLSSRRQGNESRVHSPSKRVSVVDESVEEQKGSSLARLPPRNFPAIALDEQRLPRSPKSKYVAHQSLLTEFDDEVTAKKVDHSALARSHTASITKEKENLLKSSIDLSKQQMIEQLYARIEELERLLTSERQHHEESVSATEKQFQLILEEKDARYQELSQRYEQDVIHYRKQLHEKDQHYVKLISEQEKKHKDTLEQIRHECSLHIENIQAKVLQDQEWKGIAEQARLEARGEDVRKEYEKKLRKMEKLVQQTMERYHEKALQITGSLEESRREVSSLKGIIDKKDKAFQEHMTYQDKRILQYQKYRDDYDMIFNIASTWRDSAHTLASYVIRTAGSVGQLPYDFLAKVDSSHQDTIVSTDKLFETYKEGEYIKFTKENHVAVSKGELTRAFRFGRLIHERIKSEIQPEKSSL